MLPEDSVGSIYYYHGMKVECPHLTNNCACCLLICFEITVKVLNQLYNMLVKVHLLRKK